jgi:hemoglobin/transferrin/lactoferrin receptor protein
MKYMYLRFLYTALLILAFYGIFNAQSVRVIDKTTLQPIENVVIHNANNDFVLTNDKGEAEINSFKNDSILIFKHSYYKAFQISITDIKKFNYELKMRESVLRLPEVEIPTNSWEDKPDEIPIKISSIGAKEIKFHNPQTSADLLGTSSEVFIQKSQMGGGSPMIRGFAANRVLIVVDGVRMNNAIYRSGNLQNVISIDPQSINEAEVIYGPGSVKYGSDAMGGVMDFHTLDPKLSTSDTINFSVHASTKYASANHEKTGHLGLNYSWKKIGFYTNITYSDFDDMRMGKNGKTEYLRDQYVVTKGDTDVVIDSKDAALQRYTGYNQINILQKIRYRPNKKVDVNYGFHYSASSDIPRYDRLIQYNGDALKYAEWYYGPQKWMMNNLSLEYENETRLYNKIVLNAAMQNYEESRHSRKLYSKDIKRQTENVDLLSLNINIEKKFNEKIDLLYGIEGISNKIHSKGYEENITDGTKEEIASRYPDGSFYNSYAAYLNIKNKLSKKLILNTGARYSYVNSESLMDTTYYDFPFSKIRLNTGAFNGSLGLVYQLETNIRIYTNISSGFRAPNIDDVGKVFDSEPGKVIVPNDDLSPEYLYNGDLGFMAIIMNRFQIEVTGFYSYLHNAMVRRDHQFNGMDSILYDGEMSKVQAIVNTGMAYVYGGHFSISSDIAPNFSVKTNMTYIYGEEEDESTGEMAPLRHAPPLYASLHLIYLTDKLKADLYGIYNDEIPYEYLALSERDKTYMYATDLIGNPYSPSWFTINFKAGYQLNKSFHIMAGIENILDSRYRSYSSGIVAPGRNFIIGLRGNF